MKTKQMLCLDFDKTMVWGHFHAACAHQKFSGIDDASGPGYIKKSENGQLIKVNANAAEEVISNDNAPTEAFMMQFLENNLDEGTKKRLNFKKSGPKYAERLLKIIKQTIDKGGKVSIVSRSLYPQVIFRTLEYMFKNEIEKDKYLKDICVVVGYAKSDNDGKEEHIKLAIQYFKDQKIEREDCLLVDDERENISVARKLGFEFCVKVPSNEDDADDDYLRETEEALENGHPINEKDREKFVDYLNENGYESHLKKMYSQFNLNEKNFNDAYESYLSNLKDIDYQSDVVHEEIRLMRQNEEYSIKEMHQKFDRFAESFFEGYDESDDEDEDRSNNSDHEQEGRKSTVLFSDDSKKRSENDQREDKNSSHVDKKKKADW